MTLSALVFLLINAIALLMLPRRWAPLPLLLGACYMTLGPCFEVGPLSFTIIRILALAGLVRVVLRRERVAGGLNRLDKVLLIWAAYAIFSCAFHRSFEEHLIGQLGLVYNTFGIYFLIRVFCQTREDIIHLVKIIAMVLVPVALEMINEQLTGRNLFAFLGGVEETVTVRGGKMRAQGPFQHPILAGTVGGVCLPLMVGIWRQNRLLSSIGLASCLAIVFASNSSGPLLSVILAGFALCLWRFRHFTRQMRIGAVVVYILLDLVMKAPAYYLMARIDLTGSSTGDHRAALIQSSIEHLDEWWFAGTDVTRHWMPTGVSWSEEHTDITNHYLQYGVVGGLPLMALFIYALAVAFGYVGRSLRLTAEAPVGLQFLIWTLGASLFAHAASCISVSYFDQSFLFLYMTIAAIGALPAASAKLASSERLIEP